MAEGKHLPREGAEIALLQAAIETYDGELDAERAQFFTAAARGRPEVDDEVGRGIELTYSSNTYDLRVFRLSDTRYRIDVEGQRLEVEVERFEGAERRLSVGDRQFRVQAVDQGLNVLIEVDGVPHRISRDQGAVIRAPSPSVVVNVLVNEGQQVEVGEPLIILEAMKMEMVISAK